MKSEVSFEFLTWVGDFEVWCLLGCGAVFSGRNVSTLKVALLSVSAGQICW